MLELADHYNHVTEKKVQFRNHLEKLQQKQEIQEGKQAPKVKLLPKKRSPKAEVRHSTEEREELPLQFDDKATINMEWLTSKPHRLLLSKLLKPKMIDDFSPSWESVLGESPRQAIQRFISDGTLAEADLSGYLDYKYGIPKLKEMLKERGLAVSDHKGDLIQRLVEADTDGMKNATKGPIVLRCSPRGEKLAKQFVSDEDADLASVERRVFAYLQEHRFREASEEVASYEARQVFPRGVGMDWAHHNPAGDIEALNVIFSSTPKILAGLEAEKLEQLQSAAGMMYLWGEPKESRKWLSPNFETSLALDNDAAARMIWFFAMHKQTLARYRAGQVGNVRILSALDSCEACRTFEGRVYALDDVPELPHEKCTHIKGCRCTYVPVVEDYR